MAKDRPKTSSPDIGAILPILHGITIFGGLSDKQLATLFAQLEGTSFGAGETIFEQGQTASGIYVVLSGRVKIVARVDDTPMELVEYRKGQCFGETSAIGILPHSATAHVIEDTAVLVLSARALHSLYHEDPPLFGLLILNIAREACRRLNKTDQIMLHYASAKTNSHPN